MNEVKIEDYRKTHTTEWLNRGHDLPNGKEQPVAAAPPPEDDPEEKRIAQLAARARKGDYDGGKCEERADVERLVANQSRARPRAAGAKPRLPHR